MSELSPELKEFLQALEEKREMVAMIAPSFPIVFPYPSIVGKLKRLGFTYVVEVARGAEEVNQELLKLMKANPKARYITSPCPTIVRLIRTRHPHLIKYLAPVGSPMAMTAKLVRQKFPRCQPVFIGPCLAKKTEAREDLSDFKIIVLTHRELQEVFRLKGLKDVPGDQIITFDIIGLPTRLYPISGGLSQSSGLNELLTDEEYDVVSGPKLSEEVLNEFEKSRLKLLDILYCDGGCINGPGIASQDSTEQRRLKVLAHWTRAIKE